MAIDPLVRIEEIAVAQGRYPAAAYLWVLSLLEFARRRQGIEGHLSGTQVLEAHRTLAYEQFGPMAYEVFRHWGLLAGEDVGRVVFDLVEGGVLLKTEDDSIEDFRGAYNFEQAFVSDYPW
ncbi:MAG: hypothetical protein IT349_03990 [Candidatus Eisenbacteria bacterium]|nr:hypothetical protein [Candidatus Eisenbacteria bacterium]MCC7141240.1 hypothetical protein [Candidatus Eisenbacteria bacterium]